MSNFDPVDPLCASVSLVNMTDLVVLTEDANVGEWRQYLGHEEDEQWEVDYPLELPMSL
jgi:hypothetical protein